MTDADAVLVEREGRVSIVSINRVHCGNSVEGFARKPAWPRAFAPFGFHQGSGQKKRCPRARQSSTTDSDVGGKRA